MMNKMSRFAGMIARRYNSDWMPIFVSVDTLVSTLVIDWALRLLPKGWYTISWQELLAIIVIADVAILGIMMLISRKYRSQLNYVIARFTPAETCKCDNCVNYEDVEDDGDEMDWEDESLTNIKQEAYDNGYQDGYDDGKDEENEENR